MTLDDVAGLATAYCNLSLEEFWMLDTGEFGPILKMGMRKHNDTAKTMWEAARFGAWLSMSVHTKKLPKTPEKLCRFGWEKGTTPSREDLEALHNLTRDDLMKMLPKKSDG